MIAEKLDENKRKKIVFIKRKRKRKYGMNGIGLCGNPTRKRRKAR